MFRTIGWSLYGASAWVWCIGMFLPVLMLQWYGWSGFLLVSIPNVLGAMGVGLLLRRSSNSREFCAKHVVPMRWFIIATITFHTIFLTMAGSWLLEDGFGLPIDNPWILPLGAWAVAWAIAHLPTKVWPWLGTIAWITSVWLLWTRTPEGFAELTWSGSRPHVDLLWYAPVFAFGFLLCPWLDGPFHRTLQQTNTGWAFVLLGPAFGLMLFVTASYWTLEPGNLLLPILVHLIVQSIFTMAANTRELMPHGVTGGQTGFVMLLPLAGPVLAVGGAALASTQWDDAIDTYLRYMVLFGLIFPAIVLYFCTRRPWPRTARRIMTFVVLVVAACAASEAGLIQRWHPAWAAVAVGVLLIPRWLWLPPRPVQA
ncbi:MAG: hypothetical protein MK074_05980 [Phycisphaerales bacterium]|nr:hypothetical protein [Phycisphaerales bacterium]